MSKFVAPDIYETAFNCPHCQAYAQMKFLDYRKIYIELNDILEKIIKIIKEYDIHESHCKELNVLIDYFQQSIENGELHNFSLVKVCVCAQCHNISIWHAGTEKMVYPKSLFAPPPNEDLPEKVKKYFLEASNILQDSPRGACALLRLACQELIMEIYGEKEQNMKKSIEKILIENKIDQKIVKAMDALRLIGNNAVHPGQIDIEDNKSIAIALFDMLNYIGNRFFTEEKEINSLYALLPENGKIIKDKEMSES